MCEEGAESWSRSVCSAGVKFERSHPLAPLIHSPPLFCLVVVTFPTPFSSCFVLRMGSAFA